MFWKKPKGQEKLDEQNVYSFKPSYVWPNPAFPFRLYLDHPKCRIFIIENIQHNWEWISKYRSGIQDRDVFFVYCGWYYSLSMAKEASDMLHELELDKTKFHFMFNSYREQRNCAHYDLIGDVIPHNAWLDENQVMKPLNSEKVYNAIYVARRSGFKRHQLAKNIGNLALVAGNNHGNNVSEVPDHAYLNDEPLKPEEVCEKINQSYCGLLLSASEGGCFSSSEYLMCGVPVVSTHSTGGRDLWYDDYNSIVCDANPDSVAAAVKEFVKNPRNPKVIRGAHVKEATRYRSKFIEMFSDVIKQYGVKGIDPKRYFTDNFFHKMRKSNRPEFVKLFS